MTRSFILASGSPRRVELLSQLGYQFDCHAANIDESVWAGESPDQYVLRLAIAKAQQVAHQQKGEQGSQAIVLGSDTSVIVDGHILGKPTGIMDFRHMMQQLSGRMHQVMTAIAVVDADQISSQLVVTQVYFKPLSPSEIDAYWHTGEPQDKAGGYGIQGIAGQFITHIRGSYSAVVGLPLHETAALLLKFGLPTPLQSAASTKAIK